MTPQTSVDIRGSRVRLLDLELDPMTEVEAVAEILAASSTGRGGVVVTPNLDQLRQCHENPALRALVEGASLALVDGTTLLWASRLQGTPLPERVPGSGLIFSLSAAAARAGRSLFLLGGNPGTADVAAAELRRRYPGIKVAGTHCPPVGYEHVPAEIVRVEEALRAADADLVYVCLGFPKQERLMTHLSPLFPRAWFLGLGVSLSFVAGELVRAPVWMQRLGLEWLHRLVQEPRLFRRFIVLGIPFSFRLFASAASSSTRWRRWFTM